MPLDSMSSVLLTGPGLPTGEMEVVEIFELQFAVRTEIGRLWPSEA
jgi:hypothetical protein